MIDAVSRAPLKFLKEKLTNILTGVWPAITTRMGLSRGAFAPFFKAVKKRGFYPATVIDVGVAKGTAGLYTAFSRAHFVMVEPIVEFEPALKRLAQRYDAEYILAAASDTTGTAIMRIFGGLTSSTLMPGAIEGLSSSDPRLRTIETITLDSLLDRCAIVPPLLVKLDIQGTELRALDGAAELLRITDMLVLETSLYRFHGPAMPDFYDVVSYMKARGFVVYDVLGGFPRKLDGALGQVDLVFVQEDGRFRTSHAWE